MFNANLGFGQQRFDERIVVIIVQVLDCPDAGGGQNLRAVNAGEMRDVNRRPHDGNTALGGVGNRVLLGVDRRLFVPFTHAGTMRRAGQKAVVPGGNHAVRVRPRRNEHATDMQAFASGTRGNQDSHRHEIRVPGRTLDSGD